MKKTLKELLWFVIPFVLIVATIIVLYAVADSRINTPKWIGMGEYMTLFSQSPEFAESVFRTVLYNVTPALLACIAVVVLQLFVKMKRPLYYGVMMAATTLVSFCVKVVYLNPKIFGLPYTYYPADTIIAKPEEFTPIFMDYLKSTTMIDILQSLLVGITTCFVIWMVELVIEKSKTK